MAKVSFAPLGDRVLIERKEKEEKIGSFYVPSSGQDAPTEGVIVAVGKGKMGDNGQLQPMYLNVGDRVLFGKYSGSEVKLDGKEYLIMRQDDVLGIINE